MSTSGPAGIRATATWRLPPDSSRAVRRTLAFVLPQIPLCLLGWWLFERTDLRLMWVCLIFFVWWGIWIRIFLTGRSFPMVFDGRALLVYDPRGKRTWPLAEDASVPIRSELVGTRRPVGRGGHQVPMQQLMLQAIDGEPVRLLRTVPEEDLEGLTLVPWSDDAALEVWNGDGALFDALCAQSHLKSSV
ncbi:MAG: hypothetical protein ACE366_13385 [Bradymonadia bacterium]